MARHLSFRSGNPALNKNTFKGMRAERSTGPIIRDDFMSIEGTVNKTAISLLLLMIAGYFSYTTPSTSLVWIGIGVGAFSAIIHLPIKEKPLSKRKLLPT